jgi:hypothetical protein
MIPGTKNGLSAMACVSAMQKAKAAIAGDTQRRCVSPREQNRKHKADQRDRAVSDVRHSNVVRFPRRLRGPW